MDVHTTNYTLCAKEPFFGNNGFESIIVLEATLLPTVKSILSFIDEIKRISEEECDILCGYEAGGLGYSLFHELKKHDINCVILAPSTMMEPKTGTRIKTDHHDARAIADCMMTSGACSYVYIPSKSDDDIKCYLRMRNDHKISLKKVKQQIHAFCLTQGYRYEKTPWTQKHLLWLRNIDLSIIDREILNEYLHTYQFLAERIEIFDNRIEEFALQKEYAESVKKLGCFLGIKTHTALSLIVEIGDFKRFKHPQAFAAFLGLVPGELSSGTTIRRTSITKAGNTHLRKLLIEASQGICKGRVGYKSKALKARQKGNLPEVISYADKANVRLRKKYVRMLFKGKNHNLAVTAIAREFACFIWGMMTDHISTLPTTINSQTVSQA